MSGRPLSALAGRQPAPARSWEEVLRAALRPEFTAEVVRPGPEDAVLFGPRCAVAGCLARGLQRIDGVRPGHLCGGHARAWRRDGEPPVRRWLRDGARSLRHQREARGCVVVGCRRSVSGRELCYAHLRHWQRAGRPALERFAASAPTVRTEASTCAVGGCRFATAAGSPLCDTHLKSFRWLRTRRPGLEPADYLAHLTRACESASPDVRPARPAGARPAGARLCVTGPVGRARRGDHAADLRAGRALATRPAGRLAADRQRRGLGPRGRAALHDRGARHPLGWVRFCRTVLQRLREQHAGREVWEWDTWPTDAIEIDGRYAHQPVRRIYFADIEPAWLKELVKRWARWRITTTTKSPASVAVSTSSLRRFTGFLAERGELPAGPEAITRELLER